MTYQETIDYLFTQTPMFQAVGLGAYKPGLDTVISLSTKFGNPHHLIKTIHIGGTNGKGSTAHTIAAVLQSAGYKVGLFTSPHLKDFRERIRINGEMIPESEVIDFVERYLSMDDQDLQPSFFELTTIMAFDYFARENVDVAVIEVGLGGRLDSTNIITPLLSAITNISLDHTALLGHTTPEIAREKAGIIKPGIDVVIGEADDDIATIFTQTATGHHAPIVFADRTNIFTQADLTDDQIVYHDTPWGDIVGSLCGDCQVKNGATILCALKRLKSKGFTITADAVRNGFLNVCQLTGLAGRWMTVSDKPRVICDTGHNIGGWQYLAQRLGSIGGLHIVIGFVNDKDVSGILAMMPHSARYYFVKPSVPRGLDSSALAEKAAEARLRGKAYDSVEAGYKDALSQTKEGDTIFVGGSTFVVADLLSFIGQQ